MRSFTLTEAETVKTIDDYVKSTNCETIEGTPIFDISNFPSNRILDFNNQFYVYLAERELIISIISSLCTKRIKQGRIEFLFDSNDNLIEIKVIDITNEEMDTLRQGLRLIKC